MMRARAAGPAVRRIPEAAVRAAVTQYRQNAAAVHAQRGWRGRLLRRQKSRDARGAAAAHVQRAWRGWSSGGECGGSRAEKRRSAGSGPPPP